MVNYSIKERFLWNFDVLRGKANKMPNYPYDKAIN